MTDFFRWISGTSSPRDLEMIFADAGDDVDCHSESCKKSFIDRIFKLVTSLDGL